MYAVLITTGVSFMNEKVEKQNVVEVIKSAEVEIDYYDRYTCGNIKTNDFEDWLVEIYSSAKPFIVKLFSIEDGVEVEKMMFAEEIENIEMLLG